MLKTVSVAALLLYSLQTVSPTTRRVAITLDEGLVINEMQDLANFERVFGRLDRCTADRASTGDNLHQRAAAVTNARVPEWINALARTR